MLLAERTGVTSTLYTVASHVNPSPDFCCSVTSYLNVLPISLRSNETPPKLTVVATPSFAAGAVFVTTLLTAPAGNLFSASAFLAVK